VVLYHVCKLQAASIYHYYYYYCQPCCSVMDTTKRGSYYYTRGPEHTVEIESDRFIPCELNPTPTIHHRIVALYGTGQFSGRRYRRDMRIIAAVRTSVVVSASFYYIIILYYIILYNVI